MKNNKLKIIIISFIFLLIIITFLIIFYIKFNNYNKNNNIEKKEVINIDKVKEIVENNYKLTYLLYGDVSIDDGWITFKEEQYYYLNDEYLKDITNVDNIVDLINKTISNDNENISFDKGEINHYINIDNRIYVQKINNPCILNKYNDQDISFEIIDDNNINIILKDKEYKVKKIDNNWYTEKLMFSCK